MTTATPYRSMTRCAYHLTEAVNSLAAVAGHLADARACDVDPEITDDLYAKLLTSTAGISAMCRARIASGRPDLAREAGEGMSS